MIKEIKASIDIGSNSILLLALEEKTDKILLNESRVTGLGRGLDVTKKFSITAMEESFQALNEYAALLKKNNIPLTQVAVTATEASRVASNADWFFQKVYQDIGFSITILSSQGEAFYSAYGVMTKNLDPFSKFVIMDIGGASTEFIEVKNNPFEIIKAISLPMGSVRATDWNEQGVCEEKIQKLLREHKQSFSMFKNKPVVCVAGTMTSLGNMYLGHRNFQEMAVENLKLSLLDLQKLSFDYKNYTSEQFLERFPFLGKRANAIAGGIEVALSSLKAIEPLSIHISTRGLRYGTATSFGIAPKFVVRKIPSKS